MTFDLVADKKRAEDALELAEAMIVKTQPQLDSADRALRLISDMIKAADAARLKDKRPHLDAEKEIDARYAPLLKPLKRCSTILREKIDATLAAVRAQQYKALDAVAQSGGEVSADTLAVAEGTENLRTPQGITETSELDFEILDENKVPVKYKTTSRVLVLAEIERTRGGCKIPGIKVVRTFGIRRKGVVQR